MPHFNKASERRAYYEEQRKARPMTYAERMEAKEDERRRRKLESRSDKRYIDSLYARKAAAQEVAALVARNARAAEKVYGPKGFVETLPVPAFRSVYRAIRQAS